ncbi:shufflon system plasmid conjugative transfer pilus tip adhesin PilV [Pseudomonas mendocina]|nr:shufflon system plasmid conjugative transfer pilus tip adhesin PilV [Pseudomonas mendocina]
MKISSSSKQQRGLALMEALFVLILAAVASSVALQQYGRYLDNITNKQAAEHATIVADAAAKYLKDNYAAVVAIAGPTSPATITTAMLKTTNYLPSGFSDKNAFGQDYTVRVIEPQPNQLQALVVSTGGQTIRELDGRRVAQYMGARGGFISSTDTSIATGSFGGWQVPLASFGVAPGAGHIATALFLEDGALVNDYLYRNAVPGKPEVNRMNTAINMNGNNLNSAGTVSAATVTASGNISATGETTTGGWFRTTGDTGWYNQKWNGGWYMNDPTWVRSYGDKNVYSGGEIRGGTLRSEGRTAVGEYLQLGGVATEGTACSPNGLVGRNAAGLTLSCQSGVWKGGGSAPGRLDYIGLFSGAVTRTNITSSPMFVSAYGGNGFGGTCGNRYQLSAAVFYGGWITVAGSSHTYDVGSKSDSIGFMVPAGSAYQVSSAPYTCGAGRIYLSEFTQ